ncbi:MAG: inorganic diphosphatase [Proteobacteria bacterium]|nr:inorganic diphosphatase [Pseudomonadota bacterium]NDC23056.1 inorganic diphosphatase [Pseudomonadota bacterium]NDD04730.1 inorganic diphosphatase [Pseudomonadota bacterium]NDG25645.1 inorganic diphosphatase [Pseudomonadota bacterium]
MHAWHDIDPGNDIEKKLNAVVEIPMDSKIKYELDKATGFLRVDRILFSSVHYPANYGFIPRTYCDDKDPLDVLILGQLAVAPLSILRVKPIGVMKMVDQGEADDKIIAVHADDPEYNHYDSIKHLPPHRMAEVQKFFEEYKSLENKKVVVESFLDRKEAYQIIRDALAFYSKTFGHRT